MWYLNLEKERHLFLDISYINIDTLVPSLYQCVETRSIEVFGLLSQSLSHLVGCHLRLSNVLERISWRSSVPLHATNTSPVNKKKFFMHILCIEYFCLQITRNRTLLFGNTTIAILTTKTSLPRLCCYLVIHIENILHPLQLLYLHLQIIYWLSLVLWVFNNVSSTVQVMSMMRWIWLMNSKPFGMFEMLFENVSSGTIKPV
jgi:hypothetical protein